MTGGVFWCGERTGFDLGGVLGFLRKGRCGRDFGDEWGIGG